MNFKHKKFFVRGLKPSLSLPFTGEKSVSPLNYSWILNGKLAIGPIPKFTSHWSQLDDDGFSARFSCCYPYEHIFPENPDHWLTAQVSLPDHRGQEDLSTERLSYALLSAKEMLTKTERSLYIHCFAGQERSALIAVGLVAILKKKDLFESLSFIKQCHKSAKPMYSHLEVLDQVLRNI
jgi:hypothetical protein